jgi:hypothetical protein
VTGLAAGERLRSSACGAEVIVVRPPDRPVELTCGGNPMSANAPAADSAAGQAVAGGQGGDGGDGGTLLGKRYVDEATGLEVLCTRPGSGKLAANGRDLTIKAPKALPASD